MDEQQVLHFLAELSPILAPNLWEQSWTGKRFSTVIVRPIPSALHSLTLFLCTVRSNSVIMCT
jgi:hypothetical protein